MYANASQTSFLGRPRFGVSLTPTLTPRRAKASRSKTSISALALRKSAAAVRSTAANNAGSRRSGNAFFDGAPKLQPLGVERAGVHHGLGITFTTKHDHEVRDHRSLALVIQMHDVLFA